MKEAKEVRSGAIHHPPPIRQCPGRQQRNALGKCSINVSVQNKQDKEETHRDDRTQRRIYKDLLLRVSQHLPFQTEIWVLLATGTGNV